MDRYEYVIRFKLPTGSSMELSPALCTALSCANARFQLSQTRYVDGDILRIPILSSKSFDKNLLTYPFTNTNEYCNILYKEKEDLAKQKNSHSNLFMLYMYALNSDKVMYKSELLKEHLQSGLSNYADELYYIIPNMRFTIQSSKPLSEIALDYEPDKKLIQTYSSSLSEQGNAVYNLFNIGGRRSWRQDYMRLFREITIPSGQYTLKSLITYINMKIRPYLPTIDINLTEDGFLSIKTGQDSFI